jgi:hypothetical protein
METHMQKLSIIRFKPKPDCLDEFAANLSAYNETKHQVFHLMKSGDELHAIVIRDADILAEDAADGVKFLDGQRHLLQEFDSVNRHTIPLSGDLIHSTVK